MSVPQETLAVPQQALRTINGQGSLRELPRVAIVSDFIDYYDHAFCPRYEAEVVWDRRSRNDMSKADQFALLEKLGFKVPEHGKVSDVYTKLREKFLPACRGQSGRGFTPEIFNLYAETIRVVVYLDEFAHRGEGKILTTLGDALREYPYLYCSRFVESEPSFPGIEYATSYRHLQIGRRSFCLRYGGFGSWMSNHAKEVEVEFLFEGYEGRGPLSSHVPYPVFAIDMVQSGPWLYAVDFNTAPGIDGTGIPLSPQEIYQLVAEWFAANVSNMS